MPQRKSLVVVAGKNPRSIKKASSVEVSVPRPNLKTATPPTKQGRSLTYELKAAELEKTRAEINQIYATEAQANEENRLKLDLLYAQVDKTREETRKTKEDTRTLRRWPLVFAVTVLTAIAAVAGVTVQFLHERHETTKLALAIEADKAKTEGDKTRLATEQLQFFKQQNPDLSKAYEQLGAAKEQANSYKDALRVVQDKLRTLEEKMRGTKAK
jgi:tetratricopeptide (TPR) repeat protein